MTYKERKRKYRESELRRNQHTSELVVKAVIGVTIFVVGMLLLT
jgi:hypothetical protein